MVLLYIIEILQVMAVHSMQYFSMAYSTRCADCFLMTIISITTLSSRMVIPTDAMLETAAITIAVCNFSIPSVAIIIVY